MQREEQLTQAYGLKVYTFTTEGDWGSSLCDPSEKH